jgi:hypothetical protein
MSGLLRKCYEVLRAVSLMYLEIKRDASRFIHRTWEVNSEWKSLRHEPSGEESCIMRFRAC